MPEQDNQHFEQLRSALNELAELEPQAAAASAQGAAAASTTAAASPIDQFCAIWPAVRTAIGIIVKIPFIPSGVKSVLNQLLNIGNLLCAGK
ncbi:MAG TPA: hypothetical protein VGX50_15260 [Longimicrobium sp.]|jgi:hypothetical protein|nr:hypothetical protein [Longimicrobium sp.]